MKKKHKTSKLFNADFRITIDPNMKPTPVTGLVARKLAEANEHLSKIKNLDEILKRHSSPE